MKVCLNRLERPLPKVVFRVCSGFSCWDCRSPLEEIQAAGPGERPGAVSGPELAVDVVGMGLHRAHGDEEVPGDLRVGPPGGEQAQHLELAPAQWIVESPPRSGPTQRP